MGEKKTINAALSRIAQNIGDEIGEAPICRENAKALAEPTTQFIAIDRTMTSTAEQVKKAGQGLLVLKKDMGKWETTFYTAAALGTRLDYCLELFDFPPKSGGPQSSTAGTEE